MQTGTVVLAVSAVAAVILVVALRAIPVVMIIGLVILALMAVTFGRLEVVVDDAAVRCRFGLGFPRVRFALSEIVAVQAVRNRWWFGWGIRLTPHGWMWNCSGLGAVVIVRSSGKSFVIGTDDARGLQDAIEKALITPRASTD